MSAGRVHSRLPKVHTGLSCGCERQSDCGDNGRFRVVICTKLEIWLPELRSSGRHVGQLQLQNDDNLQTLFLLHSFVRRPPNASASFTLNSRHSHSALQWLQKLPLRLRWYVHLATLSTPKRTTQLMNYTNPQDFTRIYSSLGLGRGTSVVVHRRVSMLTLAGCHRDSRSAAGIPQAPLGGRAHRRSTQCPTDDHRHSALPIRAEEQGYCRRGREDPA